jgi:hypothetical protein
MIPYANNASMVFVKLERLRPTQLSVGYIEVQLKCDEWQKLNKKQRKLELAGHVFPAVRGPGQDYYIVDHHHLGIALIEEDVKSVWVVALDDLSWLDRDTFWRTLEYRSWTHPYDHKGRRRDYRDIPRKLTQLQNDPYRSLAGLVRIAGGYAKTLSPFAEFLWADFFRPRVSARLIDRRPRQATQIGLGLARSAAARYLPGWTGTVKTPETGSGAG